MLTNLLGILLKCRFRVRPESLHTSVGDADVAELPALSNQVLELWFSALWNQKPGVGPGSLCFNRCLGCMLKCANL